MMDALTALTTRVSAARLVDPAPDGAALDTLFAAAQRAPDHGRLKPWRFVVIRGKARERFGDLLADVTARRDPTATPDLLDRERSKALRAPLIVVVAAKLIASPKIPAMEQILAAGAAAQNMLLAAHALGFGGVWKTGAPAYDPVLRHTLGLDDDSAIIGFLYLGTPADALPPAPAVVPPSEFVTEWHGGAA